MGATRCWGVCYTYQAAQGGRRLYEARLRSIMVQVWPTGIVRKILHRISRNHHLKCYGEGLCASRHIRDHLVLTHYLKKVVFTPKRFEIYRLFVLWALIKRGLEYPPTVTVQGEHFCLANIFFIHWEFYWWRGTIFHGSQLDPEDSALRSVLRCRYLS